MKNGKSVDRKKLKNRQNNILKGCSELYGGVGLEYKIAIHRLKNPSDEILSEEEFLKELEEEFISGRSKHCQNKEHLGRYKLGKELDKENLRDFAYE